MSLLDDIGSYLTTNSIVGGATGWTLRKSVITPAPDQTVAILETSSPNIQQFSTPTGELNFQVLIRGAKHEYDTARTKAEGIFSSLNQATISGYVYVFALTSAPIPLGYDNNLRPMLSWNFKARADLPS